MRVIVDRDVQQTQEHKMPPANVQLIAAEPLLRQGIEHALHPDFVVNHSFDTLAQAQQSLEVNPSDIVLLVLDPAWADDPTHQNQPVANEDSASEATDLSRLMSLVPDTAVVVLLRQPTPGIVREVCRLGARGVCESSVTPSELRATLVRALSGDVVIQPSLVRYLLSQGSSQGQPGGETKELPTLTERELLVLQLLARGYSSKQIAQVLQTTPKAVDLTIERATHRLGAHHRAQAVAIAIRRGLLPP